MTTGTTYEAPTTGTWAEYDKSVGKVGCWLHGRRYWTVQTDAGWVGVVDGLGVTEPLVSSALAQRGAVQHIVAARAARAATTSRVTGPVVAARAARSATRVCGYCGRRVAAQALCCGDHG